MTPLQDLLARFRTESPTIRDQGTAFERLMLDYFQTEPQYRDLYLMGDVINLGARML